METSCSMDSDMNKHSESDDPNGDGEGVWSPDIEQCFQEALLLFPPCGRRKHILQEEGGGKMYGRNELIARHIMMRTGKKRTRKQVSSHIQVLARRKAKTDATGSGAVSSTPSPASPMSQTSGRLTDNQPFASQASVYPDIWADRPIATQKIRLVEFCAFVEHRSFQLPTTSDQIAPNSPNLLLNHQAHQPMTEPDLSGHYQFPIHQQQHQLSSTNLNHNHLHQHHHIATANAHPLSSNHHLSSQFNQANYESPANLHCHQFQSQELQKVHIAQSASATELNNCANNNPRHAQINQQNISAGTMRHSYIQINYMSPTLNRQLNKLEKIDISQIQDKFPEIGGPDGLYRRSPPEAFFLVKFWIDLNNDFEYNIDDQNTFLGFSNKFESIEPYMPLTCSTKVCSFGRQVVEKIERIQGTFNNLTGHYSYDVHRSPMCKFMIQFIQKLRQLPRISQMNSVLENFTVLQILTHEPKSEILLCLAYVFEIASPDQNNGPQSHIYKLIEE